MLSHVHNGNIANKSIHHSPFCCRQVSRIAHRLHVQGGVGLHTSEARGRRPSEKSPVPRAKGGAPGGFRFVFETVARPEVAWRRRNQRRKRREGVRTVRIYARREDATGGWHVRAGCHSPILATPRESSNTFLGNSDVEHAVIDCECRSNECKVVRGGPRASQFIWGNSAHTPVCHRAASVLQDRRRSVHFS